ncbi:MAG: hypothetical protein KJ941_03480 [Bacteroidetes bacterium]|nr:hypothetical protein [Bacteroidota bacterium]
MKKFLIVSLVGLFVLTGCYKNTTPRNVTKAINVGTWKVARMVDNDKNITSQYNGVTFSFSDGQNMNVTAPDTSFVGSWEVPTNAKRPAHLFINLPETYARTIQLSDDWLVTFRATEEIHMERLNGKFGESDNCILRKI